MLNKLLDFSEIASSSELSQKLNQAGARTITMVQSSNHRKHNITSMWNQGQVIEKSKVHIKGKLDLNNKKISTLLHVSQAYV